MQGAYRLILGGCWEIQIWNTWVAIKVRARAAKEHGRQRERPSHLEASTPQLGVVVGSMFVSVLEAMANYPG